MSKDARRNRKNYINKETIILEYKSRIFLLSGYKLTRALISFRGNNVSSSDTNTNIFRNVKNLRNEFGTNYFNC